MTSLSNLVRATVHCAVKVLPMIYSETTPNQVAESHMESAVNGGALSKADKANVVGEANTCMRTVVFVLPEQQMHFLAEERFVRKQLILMNLVPFTRQVEDDGSYIFSQATADHHLDRVSIFYPNMYAALTSLNTIKSLPNSAEYADLIHAVLQLHVALEMLHRQPFGGEHDNIMTIATYVSYLAIRGVRFRKVDGIKWGVAYIDQEQAKDDCVRSMIKTNSERGYTAFAEMCRFWSQEAFVEFVQTRDTATGVKQDSDAQARKMLYPHSDTRPKWPKLPAFSGQLQAGSSGAVVNVTTANNMKVKQVVTLKPIEDRQRERLERITQRAADKAAAEARAASMNIQQNSVLYDDATMVFDEEHGSISKSPDSVAAPTGAAAESSDQQKISTAEDATVASKGTTWSSKVKRMSGESKTYLTNAFSRRSEKRKFTDEEQRLSSLRNRRE